jgi:uncharacterized RDD family membrane protein YckC
VKTHNLIGAFGSYTADMLIRLLGCGAFFLPVAFFVCAYRFFGTRTFPFIEPWSEGFGCFLISFSVSWP